MVVDADHRHVLGDPEVQLSGRAEHADRHLVGRGEDRGGPVGAAQELPARVRPAGQREQSVDLEALVVRQPRRQQ